MTVREMECECLMPNPPGLDDACGMAARKMKRRCGADPPAFQNSTSVNYRIDRYLLIQTKPFQERFNGNFEKSCDNSFLLDSYRSL